MSESTTSPTAGAGTNETDQTVGADTVDVNEAATEQPQNVVPDAQLLSDAARTQARAALAEITDEATIGAASGYEVNDERTVTLFFESTLAGYPGWRWAAAIARVDDDAPVTVLEVELLPGDGAMLAPEWVPWSERLAQYRDAQSKQARATAAERAAAEEAAEELSEFDDADEDALENDYADYDDELDGVDLHEGDDDDLDADDDDDSDDDSDSDEDESDDDSDDDDDDDDDDDHDDDDDDEDDSDDEE